VIDHEVTIALTPVMLDQHQERGVQVDERIAGRRIDGDSLQFAQRRDVRQPSSR
jgi:hypothetical protein